MNHDGTPSAFDQKWAEVEAALDRTLADQTPEPVGMELGGEGVASSSSTPETGHSLDSQTPTAPPVAVGEVEAAAPTAAAASTSPWVTIRTDVNEAGFTDEEYVVVDASKVIGVVGQTANSRRRRNDNADTRIYFAGGASVTVRAPLDQVVAVLRLWAST